MVILLLHILESLDKKYEIKNDFDRVINNTEGAFLKVILILIF